MVGSNPIVAIVVLVAVFLATRPIARRVANSEHDERLYRIIMVSVAIHLLAAPLQIWVVDHYYHGITDYNRYVDQGAILGPRFRRFDFSLSGTNQKFLGAGSVSVFAGVAFAIVGVNKLAAFFVFGWCAFLGAICFYRAFATTFPEASHRRYAYLIFFLPSLIFWTAGVSKEAVMFISLGLAADGAARILTRRPRGLPLLAGGIAIGIYVRPQELLLFVGVLCAATLFRPRSQAGSMRPVRFVLLAAAEVALLIVVIAFTQKISKEGSPVFNLSAVAANNASVGGSTIPYHPGPAGFFHDVYAVLFDPTLINAHGTGEHIASLENLIIVVLLLMSLRRFARMPRAALIRPYLMVCFLDVVGFCYAFASLSNLGLIDRERVLVLPFLLVLVALPISPRGSPPIYPWERSRRAQHASPRPVFNYSGRR